jgi:hypothetical protein
VAKWSQFLIRLSAVDAQVVSRNPLHWESEEKFERIVCNPRFGTHNGELAAVERGLLLLKKEGQLAVIVTPNFLWGTRQAKAREDILKRTSVSAVFS